MTRSERAGRGKAPDGTPRRLPHAGGKTKAAPNAAGSPAGVRRSWLSGSRRALLAIALFSCVLYANTLPNRLVSDDAELIPNNPATHDPLDLKRVFGERYWGGLIQNDTLYRPLTTWTLALNYGANRALGLPGASPGGFRAVNMLLNAAVCCLVYLFLTKLRLDRWAAITGAFLFAAVPIHTEAVASVVGRAEILAALFGLLFLLRHGEGRPPVIGALFLLLAMLSKESAAAFLILCVWSDICFKPRGRRPALAPYAAYAGAVVVWFAVRSAVIGNTRMVIQKLDNPLVEASSLQRIWTAASVQIDYLRLQLVPVGLSSDYSFAQIPIARSPADPKALIFLVVIISAAVIGWAARVRRPVIPFALGGYAILFLPAGNFLFPVGTIMAERLAYAPSILFCALLAYGAWAIRERFGKPVAIVLALLIGAYGVLTIARNRTWSDVETFARAQLRSAPESAKANYNLGTVEQSAGRLDAAASHFRRAIEILPEYAEAMNNLGIVHKEKGDLETAIAYYKQAIELRPGNARPLFNLGQAYHVQGRMDLAIESYMAAIRLRPDYVQALSNLGAIYLVQGRTQEAEEMWTRCLRIDPRYEPAKVNLERLRSARGR